MILFILLALTLVVLTLILGGAIAVAGASAIVVFGDVIVCIFIIVWIMKRILRKHKTKRSLR